MPISSKGAVSPSACATGSKSSMVFINSNVQAHGLALRMQPTPRDTVTLRYSNWLPVTHHLVQQLMLPWAADVEKVTEGRVKVEMLPKVVGTETA